MGHSVNSNLFRFGNSLFWRFYFSGVNFFYSFFFIDICGKFVGYLEFLFNYKYYKLLFYNGVFYSHLNLYLNSDVINLNIHFYDFILMRFYKKFFLFFRFRGKPKRGNYIGNRYRNFNYINKELKKKNEDYYLNKKSNYNKSNIINIDFFKINRKLLYLLFLKNTYIFKYKQRSFFNFFLDFLFFKKFKLYNVTYMLKLFNLVCVNLSQIRGKKYNFYFNYFKKFKTAKDFYLKNFVFKNMFNDTNLLKFFFKFFFRKIYCLFFIFFFNFFLKRKFGLMVFYLWRLKRVDYVRLKKKEKFVRLFKKFVKDFLEKFYNFFKRGKINFNFFFNYYFYNFIRKFYWIFYKRFIFCLYKFFYKNLYNFFYKKILIFFKFYFDLSLKLNFSFITLNNLTSFFIIRYFFYKLKLGFTVRDVMKPFLRKLKKSKYLLGLYTIGNGRFTRKQRAYNVKVIFGNVERLNNLSIVFFCFTKVVTKYGMCGIRIWVSYKLKKLKLRIHYINDKLF